MPQLDQVDEKMNLTSAELVWHLSRSESTKWQEQHTDHASTWISKRISAANGLNPSPCQRTSQFSSQDQKFIFFGTCKKRVLDLGPMPNHELDHKAPEFDKSFGSRLLQRHYLPVFLIGNSYQSKSFF